MMQKKTIVFQGQIIDYIVNYKDIKHSYFRVNEDLSVVVSTSKKVSSQALEQMVLQKAPWILQTQAKIQRVNQAKQATMQDNVYQDGGKIAFLGQYLSLRMVGEESRLWVLEADELRLSRSIQPEDISAVVTQFYRQQGGQVVDTVHQEVYQLFSDFGIEQAKIVLRPMTASWGRCHIKKGKIVLNLHLLKAPLSCIRSVLIHEYIHFIHPNHGAKFYQLWEAMVPDYKALKQQLQMSVNIKEGR